MIHFLFKIYDLVARRFMATVAENADVLDTEYVVEKYYELSILVNGVKFSYEGNPIKNKEEAEKLLESVTLQFG